MNSLLIERKEKMRNKPFFRLSMTFIIFILPIFSALAGEQKKYSIYAGIYPPFVQEDNKGSTDILIQKIFEASGIQINVMHFPLKRLGKHYLGTDMAGRDIFARLIYGFRIAILFSLLLLAVTYVIGVSLGATMGYLGGSFDLVFQRIIEILSNVPILYIIMIVASIITPNFWTLALLLAAFSWMGLTWYMRTETYRENTREYVLAARAIGASNSRIMFKHILPNSISILVTFFPFSVVSGITALTSLDYLGFGLPTPTPSWGELLQQGTSNLEYQWIAASAVAALSIVLTLVTFIGEAIREAFDPKKYSYYE